MSKKPYVKFEAGPGKPVRVKVNLPFQYTDEGRAQIAANQRYVKGAPAQSAAKHRYKIDNSPFPMPTPAQMDAAWAALRDVRPTLDIGIRNPGFVDVAPKAEEREKIHSHASYLSALFENPDVCITRFRTKMRSVDFDTLVGTGISGALSVQMFARAIGCNYALVRKDFDGTHSCNSIEGVVGRRWVFVDDLVASGTTRTRVRKAMEDFCARFNFESAYVGQYMYYDNTFRPQEDGNV